MNTRTALPVLLISFSLLAGCSSLKNKKMSTYEVQRLDKPMVIDANWDKPQWHNIPVMEIKNRMGKKPVFTPGVQARMMYDDQNLYVIFRVNDKYVKSVVTDINGAVYEEPAVEFFFSPDKTQPNRYFNLEVNCIGTPLMHYNDFEKVSDGKTIKTSSPLDVNDIDKIEIAHSLPAPADPEIAGPIVWTLEYRIPVEMLKKYSVLEGPAPGVEWKANFYNIAEQGSNIHFLTWSPVNNPVPNFHLPPFFGVITFR